MKLLTTTFWALLCVSLFTACSDDDPKPAPEPDPDPNKITLITEVKKQSGSEKVPYLTFTYDDNNVLTKAERYNYDEDGKSLSITSVTFSRNGKVTTANFHDISNKKSFAFTKCDLVYNDNGQITEFISYAPDDDKKVIYKNTYEWTSGRISKVNLGAISTESNETYDIKYDANGVLQTVTLQQPAQFENWCMELNSYFIPTVNTAKTFNLYAAIPFEATLLLLVNKEQGHLIRSQIGHEITKFDKKEEMKAYTGTSPDPANIQWEDENHDIYDYTYVYGDNNLPVEITESLTVTSKRTDHITPENSTGPDEDDAIITKLYPTFVQKDKK